MSRFLKYSLLLVAASVLFSMPCHSQGLEALKDDACVAKGKFANGIQYVIITDKTDKGKAEVSLLQHICPNDKTPDPSFTEGLLKDKELLFGRNCENTMLENGVSYGPRGFVESLPGAVLLRMKNVEFGREAEMTDSLLLGVMRIIDKSIKYDGKTYGTTNQTVIVTGDVDKGSVESKLKLFAMTVPSHPVTAVEDKDYCWAPPTEECKLVVDPIMDAAELTIRYYVERTSKDNVRTMLPAVTRRLAEDFGAALKRRLEKAFLMNSIALADIRTEYTSCDKGPSDECFTLKMSVPGEEVLESVCLVSEVLGGIDKLGFSNGEFQYAETGSRLTAIDRLNHPVTAGTWTDRCVSSILWGTDLASGKTIVTNLDGRTIDLGTQVLLFNNFAASLISPDKNLEIICRTGFKNITSEDILNAFQSSWEPKDIINSNNAAEKAAAAKALSKIYGVSVSDTLKMPEKTDKKTSVKKSTSEIASGGTTWTFANDMKVLYKKVPTNGVFYFSYVLNSGRSSIPSGQIGESAFLADVLKTYTVHSQNFRDFQSTLTANGLQLECQADYSNFFINGMCFTNRLGLLLKTLPYLAANCNASEKDFEYFRQCEELELLSKKTSRELRLAEMEAKMTPEYHHISQKLPDNLNRFFYGRAKEFYTTLFAKATDGTLIIMGDKEADDVLREVQQYIGNFNGSRTITPTTPVNFRLATGENRITGIGNKPSVDIASSCEFQLSTDNLMAIMVTKDILREKINSKLAGSFLQADIFLDLQFNPREVMTMIFSFNGIEGKEGKERMDQAQDIVNESLDELRNGSISDKELKHSIASVTNSLGSDEAYPYYWMEIAKSRLSCGKDFNSKHAEKIKAVSKDKVKNVAEFMSRGGKITYTVD